MDRAKRRERTLYLVQLGLLAALVVVLQYLGNFLSVALVTSINLTLIPIVIGAAILGPIGGMILGLVCGAMVLMTPMAQGIMGYSWWMALLICFGKTAVAGYVAGWIYRWVAKKNTLVATIATAIIVPIINTGLFVFGCSFLVDHFKTADPAVGFGVAVPQGITYIGFIGFICGIIAVNFVIEFLMTVIPSAPICHAIQSIRKRKIK